MTTRLAFLLILALPLAAEGCGDASAATGEAASAAAPVAQAQATAPTQAASATKVANIVFVGKEHPCDCTRKKIDVAQAALDKQLGKPPRIPVELIKIDLEPDKVVPYREQRAMMALPALYFLDAKGAVVDLLQGEVTEQQIAAALDGERAAP